MMPFRFAVSCLVIAACLASCTTTTTPVSSRGGIADEPVAPLNKPAGVSQSSWVRTSSVALGFVPFDGASLPLVSPDGRFIATQTGIAPTWSTTIADEQAVVPGMTRIEVYELDRRAGASDSSRRPPRLMYALGEPALLGRSCDSHGFLIESPRENGSRWIGHVEWWSGDTLWLIDDDQVNAFASVGPDGRLAWSRRAIDAPHFDLVVRHGDAIWEQPAAGGDWLMPAWSLRGDGLFCLRLEAGVLAIAFANAGSSEAFRQSLKMYILGPDASVSTAYQTLAGQITMPDGPAPLRDQLVYDHPALGRAAIWRPMAGTGRTAMYLNPDSFMAALIDDDTALVATEKELIRQRLSNDRDKTGLVDGAHAIRTTPSNEFEFTLLSPQEGRVGVLGLRLLPVNAAAERR
jgi:hypothetical protein